MIGIWGMRKDVYTVFVGGILMLVWDYSYSETIEKWRAVSQNGTC